MNELEWQLKESKKELSLWNRDHKSIYREDKIKELTNKIDLLEQEIFDMEYKELEEQERLNELQG
ncbi:MAG: hypothetical protein RSC21_06505 [Cetobacterium sp.]